MMQLWFRFFDQAISGSVFFLLGGNKDAAPELERRSRRSAFDIKCSIDKPRLRRIAGRLGWKRLRAPAGELWAVRFHFFSLSLLRQTRLREALLQGCLEIITLLIFDLLILLKFSWRLAADAFSSRAAFLVLVRSTNLAPA